ncbi:MAG: GNAT family N-acetyltransferase [Planctomycetaceae bacterium]|nr:GNAT family N-acetyltransferase [Planctomycetaceae bacterium]
MRSTIVIREYVPGEPVAPITALLHAAYAEHTRVGLWYMATHQDDATTRDRLESGVAFIAECGGRPVGTISLRRDAANPHAEWYRRPGVFVLGQMGVLPAFQGRGIGLRLYRAAAERARSLGATHLALDTAEGATHLIDFYIRYGFEIVEHVSWRETNYRSVVMVKEMSLGLGHWNATADRFHRRRDTMSQVSTAVGRAMLEATIHSYRANKGWADKAIGQVSDENLHVALDPNTNSIAVITKHVAGNLLSRWTDFLSSDGEKLWRNRDDEFIDMFTSRAEVLAHWESGWLCLFDTLESLTPDDLARTVTIRGEVHTVPLAMQRSLSHTAYHVGQIILVARILAGDQWSTITIPRGGSAGFNQRVWGQGHYRSPPPA